MLILSCNLDSLLFLSKNDIMFIECSDSIACSNRVKQRCHLKFFKISALANSIAVEKFINLCYNIRTMMRANLYCSRLQCSNI